MSYRAILLLALAALPAAAQSNFGSIRGQVTDQTGSAIPGAKVEIKDVGTNTSITLVTNEEGLYVAPTLRPVTYDVTVTAQGFQTAVMTQVKVDTANAPELLGTFQGQLSPACVARQLTITGGFGNLQQNAVRSRIIQFALRFYF